MTIRTPRVRKVGTCLAVPLVSLIALTSCSASGTTQAEPAVTVSSEQEVESQAMVREGDFQLQLTLEARLESLTKVPVLTEPDFEFESTVSDNSSVTKGQTVGIRTIDPELKQELELLSESSPQEAARLQSLTAQEGPVVASISGRYETSTSSIRVTALAASSLISPLQLLRLQATSFTGTATVETISGTRKVECSALWIGSSAAGSDYSSPEAESSLGIDDASIHCLLPRHIQSAAGLIASVELNTVPQRNVLLVPTHYLAYDSTKDQHSVSIKSGDSFEQIPVLLDASDGVVQVVRSVEGSSNQLRAGQVLVRNPATE